MRTKLAVACAALAALLPVVCIQAAALPPLPVYEVRPAAAPPVLDGKLDDACWQGLPRLGDFTQVVLGQGPTAYPTEARLCFDSRNLYLGVVCTETEPLEMLVATQRDHDSDVWADDGVEIFLDPDQRHSPYYHLSLNSVGARYDARGMDKAWDLAWEAGARVGRGEYTLEAAIPLAGLGASPRVGDVWGFNLCRDHAANGHKEWSGWSNTAGGFHNPGRFGVLVFGSCRAALARFVADNQAGVSAALARVSGLIEPKGSADEKQRLTAIRREVERVRAEGARPEPMAPTEWAAERRAWGEQTRKLEDLELDAQFRLLFED